MGVEIEVPGRVHSNYELLEFLIHVEGRRPVIHTEEEDVGGDSGSQEENKIAVGEAERERESRIVKFAVNGCF